MTARSAALWLGVMGILYWCVAAQPFPPRANRPAPRVGTERSAPSVTRAKDSRTETNGPPAATIGHLETRNRWVTVMVGTEGPRYTIRGQDGRLLHQHLTAQEFQAKAPALYELVNGAYARQPAKSPVTLDASLRTPRLDPTDR